MAHPSKSRCGCEEKQNDPTPNTQLGLDELMIVNPSPLRTEAFALAENGTLYQVQGLGQADEPQRLGSFFLGEDGTLYQVQGLRPSGAAGLGEESTESAGKVAGHTLGRYFLGSDGTLYELVPQGGNAGT